MFDLQRFDGDSQNIKDPGVLADVARSLKNDGDEAFFSQDGSLQDSENGAGYRLYKEDAGVSLGCCEIELKCITIDASGADLFGVFMQGCEKVLNLKIDNDTKIDLGRLAYAEGSTVQVGDEAQIKAVGARSWTKFMAASGVITLCEGEYIEASNVSISSSPGYDVKIGSWENKYIIFGESATGSYASAGNVTINTGQLVVGAGVDADGGITGSQKIVNDVTYTSAGALTFQGVETKSGETSVYTAYLTNAASATTATDAIRVAKLGATSEENVYSSITLTDGTPDNGSTPSLTVDGTTGKYTISNLAGGDGVTIDGVEYTVNEGATALQVTENNELVDKYRLISAGTIAFMINGGTTAGTAADSVDPATACEVIGSLGDGLAALTATTFADAAESSGEDAMATATTLYYNEDGEPSLTSDSTTVATLTRASATATDNYYFGQ